MKWTEQDAKDAARLLERLEQRAKRRKALAGSDLGPAQIQKSDESLSDERADGESALGTGTLDRRPLLTDNREGLAGGCEYGGRVGFLASDYVIRKIQSQGNHTSCSGRFLDEDRSRESYAPEDEG